jgi:hypothetical protein
MLPVFIIMIFVLYLTKPTEFMEKHTEPLTHYLIYSETSKQKKKKIEAPGEDWTRDLSLTKRTQQPLCYGSC